MPSQIKVSVDWAKDGNFTGAFDNVTSRVLPGGRVGIEYGRDVTTPLAPVTAGSGSLTLRNPDRRYSPRNASSPLTGLVKPGRPVKLERTIPTPTPTTYTLGPRMHTDAQPLNPDRDSRTVTMRLVEYVADLRGKNLSTALFRSIRSGDAVGKILDGIGWTAARDIDPGVSVFPFWWEEGTDALDALDKVVRSEGWPALAYVDGNGTFVFRDRHHRTFDTASATSQVTFRGSGVEPVLGKEFVADEGWDGVVNDVTVSIPIRRIRGRQVVWESDESIVVAGGEVVTVVVELTDPCTEVFVPLQTNAGATDWVVEASQDYDDNPGFIATTPFVTNVTATLSRTSGQSMILTLTNGGTVGEDETVTGITIYGRPVTSTTNVQVSASDSTSITDYGSRSMPNSDLPWCNRYDAQRIIDTVVAQRKAPLTLVACTFKVGRTSAGPRSDARANAILARGLSDRVTIIETESQINGDFYLERIRHDFADDVDHTVTLWLEAVPPTVAPALADVFTFDNNTAGRRFNTGTFG